MSGVPSLSSDSARSTSGPPSLPGAPSVPMPHSLNSVVADQVHRLAPRAAPDADAAAGVDGAAQPAGGRPHHLREDADKGG